MNDLDIRELDDAAGMRRATTLFSQIWGSATPLVGVELLRAVQHAGGYVVAAYQDNQIVGGSFGFLGRHEDEPSLHSHVTGVLPGVRHTGVGRAMKLHQRAWAADHGLAWVTWTFDPLVRRNAHFNIEVLRAHVHEYLVDFYGPIDDAVNAGDESDRLLVAWPTGGSDAEDSSSTRPAGAIAVPTPEDIVVLRRTDTAAARAWRHRLRTELGDRLAAGARVVGFSDDGDYLVAP
jgi:predicted GNAT superfamily acetyltransferase